VRLTINIFVCLQFELVCVELYELLKVIIVLETYIDFYLCLRVLV